MPYITQWVDPDLFLEHQGVQVWHTYKEQEYDDRLHYWFTADPDNTDRDSYFDVRELPAYASLMPTPRPLSDDIPEFHKTVIRAAIEQHLVAPPTPSTEH